ncbi:MAG: alpha/beta hydrolase, partial [Mesorhizobium sp.]
VDVDTLFFPDDYSPPLPHEYQFDLERSAGEKALENLTGFLDRLANQSAAP